VEALDYLLGDKPAAREAHDLPSFVILDLNIPKLDGLAVLKAIRADERTRHLPVIILTSSGEESDRLAAYDHYANSYIIKPLDYDKFVEDTLQLCQYWTQLNAPAPLKDPQAEQSRDFRPSAALPSRPDQSTPPAAPIP
jgi:two-component system response regulator